MDAKTNAADSWRDRLAAQKASGQSIRAWCKASGCHEHSFYWWRARLKLQPSGNHQRRRADSINPITFAEIVGSHPAEPIRLRLSEQRELLLPASMAVDQVAKLVRAIEGLP
jgi:hypothetical protein